MAMNKIALVIPQFGSFISRHCFWRRLKYIVPGTFGNIVPEYLLLSFLPGFL